MNAARAAQYAKGYQKPTLDLSRKKYLQPNKALIQYCAETALDVAAAELLRVLLLRTEIKLVVTNEHSGCRFCLSLLSLLRSPTACLASQISPRTLLRVSQESVCFRSTLRCCCLSLVSAVLLAVCTTDTLHDLRVKV